MSNNLTGNFNINTSDLIDFIGKSITKGGCVWRFHDVDSRYHDVEFDAWNYGIKGNNINIELTNVYGCTIGCKIKLQKYGTEITYTHDACITEDDRTELIDLLDSQIPITTLDDLLFGKCKVNTYKYAGDLTLGWLLRFVDKVSWKYSKISGRYSVNLCPLKLYVSSDRFSIEYEYGDDCDDIVDVEIPKEWYNTISGVL